MTVGRVVWGILSAAIAVLVNLQQKASFVHDYDRAEYESRTGQVTLHGSPGVGEVPLANVHIVTTDFHHVGKSYPIREVVVRAADDVLATPRLELFAGLPGHGMRDLAEGPHLPTALRGIDLPIQPTGFMGERSSYVLLLRDERAAVVSGVLRFDDVTEVPGTAASQTVYMASGELRMQVETQDGLRTVNGKLEARLVWDKD
ncbi:MAG TPA: hypothetical protein VHM19_14520 [Polyangiales bacterium]|nr:hypothetical protein [Polyangiales bacterium]